jgi:hypothetical protein
MPLDGEIRVLEKPKVCDLLWIVEVDEDANTFPGFGVENGGEQSAQAERREFPVGEWIALRRCHGSVD